MAPAFKRILLKLSGEALMGDLEYGTDPQRVVAVRRQVAAVRDEGLYSADPAIDPDAEFTPEITHMEALERRLRVMDSTALALCMENAMPLNVFNMDDETSLARIISGVRVGTLVTTPRGERDGD